MTTPTPTQSGEPAWLHSHVHEPNPTPPTPDPTFQLTRPDGTTIAIGLGELLSLPQRHAENCYIVSTGHGTSGPFRFEGVTLSDLFAAQGITTWRYADVVSADGFGTRVQYEEVSATTTQPILLALACDGKPLTREQGLVRLIVPQERDDALRQVKWVAQIQVF